jgi:hypothetical protein
MPAVAPVEREEEAAGLEDEEADEDVVLLLGAADAVVEAVVADAKGAVVELAEAEVDVALELVVAVEVSLDM